MDKEFKVFGIQVVDVYCAFCGCQMWRTQDDMTKMYSDVRESIIKCTNVNCSENGKKYRVELQPIELLPV